MWTKLAYSSLRSLATVLLVVVGSSPALAQDPELDDILRPEEEEEESISEERQDVLEGDLDDRVGTRPGVLPEEQYTERRPRPIKTLQPKTFLKIGRYEIAPFVGFVTNDPFMNRYMFGADATYHATEVFGVQLAGGGSLNSQKPITEQLVGENQVSPDISNIGWFGTATLQFSPIYGKVAVGPGVINFDVYGLFGFGIVQTSDDLEALQGENNPVAQATASQIHPTSNFGGGFRVIFSPNVAARLEGRSMIYIETVNSTTLEMKNNFMVLGALSFFLPGMQ